MCLKDEWDFSGSLGVFGVLGDLVTGDPISVQSTEDDSLTASTLKSGGKNFEPWREEDVTDDGFPPPAVRGASDSTSSLMECFLLLLNDGVKWGEPGTELTFGVCIGVLEGAGLPIESGLYSGRFSNFSSKLTCSKTLSIPSSTFFLKKLFLALGEGGTDEGRLWRPICVWDPPDVSFCCGGPILESGEVGDPGSDRLVDCPNDESLLCLGALPNCAGVGAKINFGLFSESFSSSLEFNTAFEA